jgi:hypothetical protein
VFLRSDLKGWLRRPLVVQTNNEPFKLPHLERMRSQHLLRLQYGCVVIRAFNRLDRNELFVHVPNRIDAVLWHDTSAH